MFCLFVCPELNLAGTAELKFGMHVEYVQRSKRYLFLNLILIVVSLMAKEAVTFNHSANYSLF